MTQRVRSEDLVDRFAAVVLSRQIHVMQTVPEILTSGYDLDLIAGSLRFRSSGRTTPIQVIGTERQNTWMWGWANTTIAPDLTRMSAAVRDWGARNDMPFLTSPGLRLEEPVPGAELTGMSVSAIAAGLLDAPAIYVCFDRARGNRLYLLLLDEAMREPKPVNPLVHVVHRFPLCLAQAVLSSHDGGIALPEWLPALAGFCQAYGVTLTIDDDRRDLPNSDGAVLATLRWQDRTAFVRKDAGGLRMEIEDDGTVLDACANVVRDASLLNLPVHMDDDGIIRVDAALRDVPPPGSLN